MIFNTLMGGGILSGRRRFMNELNVPYDAEVEYLESTGVQYIDTGIIPDNALSFEGRFMVTGSADAMCVTACRIGTTTNDSRDQFSFLVYTSIYARNYVCWGAWETMFNSGNGKEYSNVLCDVIYDNSHIEINGVTCATYQNKNIEPKGISVWLFGRNNNRRLQFPFIGRIYKAVYKMNGKVIMDLIPVRVGNVGYMYNRVNGELLGNSGSGSFILGPDVVECPFQRVEYIQANESTGMAWIDTEYIPNGKDIEIEMDFFLEGWHIQGSGYPCIFHNTSSESSCSEYRVCRSGADGIIQLQMGSAVEQTTKINMGVNQRLKIKLSGYSYEINGIKGDLISSVGTENKDNLYLFYCNPRTTATNNYSFTKGKLYSFRLDKAGTTVLDLIPVRVDDVGYMYDKVSGKLMGNGGAGSFALGPDIV